MASLGNTFKATDFDTEQRDYSELPNGIYRLEIEASDVTPTKDGRGTVLKTTNRVIEPVLYEGLKLFVNYNLENPSVAAQEAGQRQFASLCRAIGIDQVEDSESLHFVAYTAKVRLGKPSKETNSDGTPKYPARAEIGRYYFPDSDEIPEPSIDDAQPKPAANDNRPAARPAAAQPAAAKPAGVPAWRNKVA